MSDMNISYYQNDNRFYCQYKYIVNTVIFLLIYTLIKVRRSMISLVFMNRNTDSNS